MYFVWVSIFLKQSISLNMLSIVGLIFSYCQYLWLSGSRHILSEYFHGQMKLYHLLGLPAPYIAEVDINTVTLLFGLYLATFSDHKLWRHPQQKNTAGWHDRIWSKYDASVLYLHLLNQHSNLLLNSVRHPAVKLQEITQKFKSVA